MSIDAKVIFAKTGNYRNALFGKVDTPIKAVIQSESDAYEKQKSTLDKLFIVEKSNRFGESIVGTTEFAEFLATAEGEAATPDSSQQAFRKFVEHIQFMKEFTVTAEMAEDSITGLAADANPRAKAIYAAYEKTKIALAARALANGTNESYTSNGVTVDLTGADGKPVFYKEHPYAKEALAGKTQSNYFCGNITKDAATLETALNVLSNKLRNVKDENETALQYVANVIIIPSNRPKLEAMVKKVVGSERTPGTNDNDINIQYGNWDVVVLPYWETNDDRFIIMSEEANESLMGNVFFNRVPLTVTPWEDHHTANLIWTGRCRFGLGFNAWKHMALAVNGTVENATLISNEDLGIEE